MEELLELLKRWIEEFNDDFNEEDITTLKNIYQVDFRHSYSELSKFIESLGSDERDYLCKKLDKLLIKLDDLEDYSKPKYETVIKGIFKLSDHVNLETIRLNRMKQIDFLSDETTKNLKEIQEIQKKNIEEAENISNQISGFHGQSMLILGIFATIVVGFSAEIELVNGTLDALKEIGLRGALVVVVLLGLVLINVLFLLLYTLSKIAGKSIAVDCKHRGCEVCRDNCKKITKMFKKYPYILFSNMFFIVVLMGLWLSNYIVPILVYWFPLAFK